MEGWTYKLKLEKVIFPYYQTQVGSLSLAQGSWGGGKLNK